MPYKIQSFADAPIPFRKVFKAGNDTQARNHIREMFPQAKVTFSKDRVYIRVNGYAYKAFYQYTKEDLPGEASA